MINNVMKEDNVPMQEKSTLFTDDGKLKNTTESNDSYREVRYVIRHINRIIRRNQQGKATQWELEYVKYQEFELAKAIIKDFGSTNALKIAAIIASFLL